MDQEFLPHSGITDYEASRDGVVTHRRLNKSIGFVDNHRYLRFGAGVKIYYCHGFAYDVVNGLIKDGLVIDHIGGCFQNNKLDNLQAFTQSENIASGNSGTYKSIGKRPVQSFITTTNEDSIFQSMTEAGRYFDICEPSVQNVAEGIQKKSSIFKKTGRRIQFVYIKTRLKTKSITMQIF